MEHLTERSMKRQMEQLMEHLMERLMERLIKLLMERLMERLMEDFGVLVGTFEIEHLAIKRICLLNQSPKSIQQTFNPSSFSRNPLLVMMEFQEPLEFCVCNSVDTSREIVCRKMACAPSGITGFGIVCLGRGFLVKCDSQWDFYECFRLSVVTQLTHDIPRKTIPSKSYEDTTSVGDIQIFSTNKT